jgi:pimeloyl-ACP methyl ester carboxylesterase
MRLRSRSTHLKLATVLALALGAGLLIAGCAGSTTNSTAESADTTMAAPAPRADFSGLIEIGGGRKIYMTCRGTGSPTVVLVSGLGNAADAWSVTSDPKNERPVFAEVAKFTRVCAYDRPGTIRVTDDDKPSPSTPVRQPTSAKAAAADLDALLGASGDPAPYVLAGHSYGGPIIRHYASAPPAEVGGLVLVDALSEDLPDGLSPKQEKLNEELNTPPPGSHREDLDESATFKQLRESPPAPTVPTVVLTADRPQALAKEQLPPGADQQFTDDLWDSQLAAQDKLAKKFPGAEHITDTNSTHYIQVENPQLVSESIRRVVEAQRDGEKILGKG